MQPRGDSPPIEWSEIVLQRYKVGTRAALSAQLMHDLRARTHVEMMTDRMMLELQTTVYGRKVDDRKVTRSYARPAPRPRGLVAAFGFLTLVLTFIGLLTGSLPLVMCAALVAGAGIIVVCLNPPQEVRGTLTVEVDDVDTFPDNTMVFPDHLGSAVRIPMVQRAYWED